MCGIVEVRRISGEVGGELRGGVESLGSCFESPCVYAKSNFSLACLLASCTDSTEGGVAS